MRRTKGTRRSRISNELRTANKLTAWSREPGAIVQVGVGRGLESEIFRHHWPACPLIGIDPHDRVNKASYAGDIICKLAGADVGQKLFYYDSRWLCSSATPTLKTKKVALVEQTTIDTVMKEQGLKGPIMLWLDCEGGEYDALLGGRKALAVCDFIHIELWTGNPYRLDILEMMSDSGFECIDKVVNDFIYKRKDVRLATRS